LEVNLLLENKEKRAVYKGDKETVLANVEQISVQVEKAYNDV